MDYFYDDDKISEIRESNDIVDTISEYINLKRTGSNYKGLCPFHNEKTPSFVVSPDKQMFHCFGCGEGGDVISFVMKHENLEFIEVLKILADKKNIRLEKRNANVKVDRQKNILYEINREAGIYFFRNLANYRMAYQYLINRGIDRSTTTAFGLGYALDSWNSLLNYLKGKNYKEEDIEKAGLIIRHEKSGRYYDRFRNRIVFPIIDVRGKVIGFGGRAIHSDNHPKYLNSPDTPVFFKGNNLYSLNIAKKHNRNEKIILTEGYMDVISLYRYGIKYSVASLGTALTLNQAQLLKRYSNEIYICYDSDEAGINATNKAIDILEQIKIRPKIIVLPNKRDPDDFIKENGIKEFQKLMQNSMTSIEFKIEQKKKKHNIKEHEGKINFVKEISNILKSIKSPVELEVYIEKIASETNISSTVIKSEINADIKPKDKYINAYNRYNNKENIVPVKVVLKPSHLTAERELLNIIMSDKNIYSKVKEKFKPDDFVDETYRKLSNIVYNFYESNIEIDQQAILGEFEEIEKPKVNEVLNSDIKINDDEKIKAVDDYIKNINYYKINMKKEEIKKKINLIDNKLEKTIEDNDMLNKLCLELINIDKQLKTN